MKRLLILLAAVLATPAVASACESVQLVAAPVYAQQFVAAPVVYQAQVQAVQVQSVAYAPVVQQVAIGHHCRQAVRVQRQRIRVRPARVQQVNVQVY